MTSSPQTPIKGTSKFNKKIVSIDDNMRSRINRQQSSRMFVTWYKHLLDSERQNIGLYLSDDITLQWFGRTIKTRKKVFSFLKNDVEFSKHYFTSVESIDKIKIRTPPRKSVISPTCSPDTKIAKKGKRKLFEPRGCSPEWAPGCKPDDEFDGTDKKRSRTENSSFADFEHNLQCSNERNPCNNYFISNNKGDGVGKRRKLEPITPPNIECGQGDCMPSTSSDSNKSHEALNAQLPKLAVECNGYVEFTRTRNNHNVDCSKWERKFKLQISYSEDPLNVGEFIIWEIWYSDESKCRRNLLAAFNEVAQEVTQNV